MGGSLSPSLDDSEMPPPQSTVARSQSAHPDFSRPKPSRTARKYERNLKSLLKESDAGRKRHLSFDFQHHKFRVFDLNINLTEVDIPISQIERVVSMGKRTHDPQHMVVIMGRHVMRTPAKRVTIYFRSSNANADADVDATRTRSVTDVNDSRTRSNGLRNRSVGAVEGDPSSTAAKATMPRSIDVQFENSFDETYFCGLCQEFGVALHFEDMQKMYECNRQANDKRESRTF